MGFKETNRGQTIREDKEDRRGTERRAEVTGRINQKPLRAMVIKKKCIQMYLL